MITIRRALFSAYCKDGLIPLAQEAAKWGAEIVASGGTAKTLRDAGLDVISVESITGTGSLFGGRVKTLHPKIHGGILYRRELAEHQQEAEAEGIEAIDLVVVNLYPFTSALENQSPEEETIEMIDIGGPAMVRGAAKNHKSVAVVTLPEDYARVQAALAAGEGQITETFAKELAARAFRVTANYDAAVAGYLETAGNSEASVLPNRFAVQAPRQAQLRYGENPAQDAGLYGLPIGFPFDIERLHGKELSYNNYLDIGCGRDVICEFAGELTAVVIKHGIPSGVANGASLESAYLRARDADALSAFGSVVVFNRMVDMATAHRLNETFVEAIVAPGFADDALVVLKKKKKRSLLKAESETLLTPSNDLRGRFLGGGFLLQTPLPVGGGEDAWEVRTETAPDDGTAAELRFAWRVLKHVRSNGVLFARDGQTLGIGSGQTSRIDAVESAIAKATRSGHHLEGSVLVSDAFFPFADSVERAASVGVKAILQPGGSVRDDESIDACNRLGMSMVTNAHRVFSHG